MRLMIALAVLLTVFETTAAMLDIALAPVSHDPSGFKIYIDDTLCATGQPPWRVDVGNLTAGLHKMTVQSVTFPDMEDSATITIVKVDIAQAATNILWTTPSMALGLSDDSYPGGSVDWSVSPSGLPFTSSGGTSITCFPSNGVPGQYTVKALSIPPVLYQDICTVNVLKVMSLEAGCDKFGATGSFSNNPVVFEGGKTDFGQPDREPPICYESEAKALLVFFKYIKNADDEPGAFDIDLTASIVPTSVSDSALNITWSKREGPSASGSFNETAARSVKFQNPTQAGLYKFRMNMQPTPVQSADSEAWVLLPKAGGEIHDWVISEVPSLVTNALGWKDAVRAVALSNGLNVAQFQETAWKAIATADFDYQGVVGSPTRRYSFTDADRPDGHSNKGDGDWNEPSYATLSGIVVHRCKINNMMYAVWGRTLGYSTQALKAGAIWNAAARNLWDDSTSQNAVTLGGDLYDAYIIGGSLSTVLTKSAAKNLQTPDNTSGLNDVNLWPDTTLVTSGFWLPTMPTDYDSLKDGADAIPRGRLF